MIRNLAPFVCLFLFVSGLMPGQIHGDIYIWTDEDGIRRYSNIAPPDRGAFILNQETAPTGSPAIAPVLPSGERFKVTRIFDGDTLEAQGAGLTFKVRLAGIDTPESGRRGQKGQPYAKEAEQILKDRVMGRMIRLKQYGTGGYNRILAEIFYKGQNINLHMVVTGMAEVYQGRLPEGLDIKAYEAAQARAKKSRTGIWSQGKRYKSPRQWRKENPWK